MSYTPCVTRGFPERKSWGGGGAGGGKCCAPRFPRTVGWHDRCDPCRLWPNLLTDEPHGAGCGAAFDGDPFLSPCPVLRLFSIHW